MKVLVTGANGLLGNDVLIELMNRGYDVVGTDIHDDCIHSFLKYFKLDITQEDEVLSCLINIRPEVIIHCAAWTQVDAAEAEENKDFVYKINSIGTYYIAKVCKMIGAKMIYISTDYVFNGQGVDAWQPDCKDYSPLNVYGDSKLLGEFAVYSMLNKYFIVRIAWVFGLNGKNFIKTMVELSKKHNAIKVVNDQVGTPTYTYDLARLLVDMVNSDKYGYYHVTNEGGYISWYDLACEIMHLIDSNTHVIPVTTHEYGLTVAARPKNSRLDKTKLVENGFKPLPTWDNALRRYLDLLLDKS